MRTKNVLLVVSSSIALVIGGCKGSGDTPEQAADDRALDSVRAVIKTRRAKADSLIKAAPEVADVAKQLGTQRYDVADADIEAAVKREAEKTADCYTKARLQFDPDLSIVLYVLVNYGGAGWDLMRVERWNATSPNGGAVVSCINARAKAEWKLPEKGVKPGAHLVKLVYTPPDSTGSRP